VDYALRPYGRRERTGRVHGCDETGDNLKDRGAKEWKEHKEIWRVFWGKSSGEDHEVLRRRGLLSKERLEGPPKPFEGLETPMSDAGIGAGYRHGSKDQSKRGRNVCAGRAESTFARGMNASWEKGRHERWRKKVTA